MLRPALDLVLSALEQIRENPRRRLCASRAALAQLFDASPVEAGTSSESESGRKPKIDMLGSIHKRGSVCAKCPPRASSRTQTVFGVGNPDADLMFIGESPGADADAPGEPFVWRGGPLRTRLID